MDKAKQTDILIRLDIIETRVKETLVSVEKLIKSVKGAIITE